MGKHIAPATKKPHIACAKQVKMCVSHAAKQAQPMMYPISLTQGEFRLLGVAVVFDLRTGLQCLDQVIL